MALRRPVSAGSTIRRIERQPIPRSDAERAAALTRLQGARRQAPGRCPGVMRPHSCWAGTSTRCACRSSTVRPRSRPDALSSLGPRGRPSAGPLGRRGTGRPRRPGRAANRLRRRGRLSRAAVRHRLRRPGAAARPRDDVRHHLRPGVGGPDRRHPHPHGPAAGRHASSRRAHSGDPAVGSRRRPSAVSIG